MIAFILFLAIMTAGWTFFLIKNRMNPKRGLLFIVSSLAYFTSVFLLYYLTAGGTS